MMMMTATCHLIDISTHFCIFLFLIFRYLPNGNRELGVHIADVTYFVKPNSMTDMEARSKYVFLWLSFFREIFLVRNGYGLVKDFWRQKKSIWLLFSCTNQIWLVKFYGFDFFLQLQYLFLVEWQNICHFYPKKQLYQWRWNYGSVQKWRWGLDMYLGPRFNLLWAFEFWKLSLYNLTRYLSHHNKLTPTKEFSRCFTRACTRKNDCEDDI